MGLTGGVPCARSFSTASSTQVINGHSAVTVTMQFPVAGSSGRQALAVVRQAKSGSSSSSPVTSIEVASLPVHPELLSCALSALAARDCPP